MKKSILLFLWIFIFNLSHSQESATQIRAVWFTTNWQLDWPSPARDAEEQKQQLTDRLDSLQKLHFNTVLFQVRIRGSVLYRSSIEKMSPFVKTRMKDGNFFDPLAYAIEECHKRNMECHAWMVVYPLGSQNSFSIKKQKGFLAKNPEICKLYKGEWYLDPGNPKTREYLLSIVREIVEGYDIDGIHFDYIRYPDENATFPDKATFKKYGNGESLADWRRSNVTQFVKQAYDYVKSTKPWVQMSSSPIGIFRSLTGKGNKWSGFESVYQDTYNWLKLGVQDAVYPMMYYQDKNFYPYVEDWMKNANGRFIVSGLGIYKMLPHEDDWNLQVITKQIEFLHSIKASGEAYFRLGMILENVKGIKDSLKVDYRNPAKLPPMTWLSSKRPNAPINFQIYRLNNDTVQLSWEAPTKDDLTYNVYSCSPTDSLDINNPRNIVASGLHACQLKLAMENSLDAKFYAVSASNRFHNESKLDEIAYFLPSLNLQK